MKDFTKYSYFDSQGRFINKLFKEDYESIKNKEYKLFYDGNIHKLIEFYKTLKDRQNQDTKYFTPSFYKLAPTGGSINNGDGTKLNNFTVYHDPIPNVISRAMSDLLFSTEPTISFNSPSKTRTEAYEENFIMIKDENDFATKLQKSGEFSSYSGAIGFKPILDEEFSDVPLFQIYPKADIIVNKKYDKLVSLVFKDYFEDEDEKYILLSEYGRGYIKYKLINAIDKVEVELSKLDYTSNLQDLTFFNSNTNEVFDSMLAIYIENRPGGRSDYENNIDDFQASDEVYSNMMNFIRKSGVKRIISEGALSKTINGDTLYPSSYNDDVIIKWDNTPDNNEETNEVQTVDGVEGYIRGYLDSKIEILKNVSRATGLSIKTLLGEDPAGANSSAEALSIRENLDLRTRQNKEIAWNEGIKKLIKLLMILNTMEQIGNNVFVNPLEELEVNIEFYNPATPTFEQLSKEVSFLKEQGLLSKYEALMRLWFDTGIKSEDEVKLMYEEMYGDSEEMEDEEEQNEEENDNNQDNEEDNEEEGSDE
jgi:hypothetical protein